MNGISRKTKTFQKKRLLWEAVVRFGGNALKAKIMYGRQPSVTESTEAEDVPSVLAGVLLGTTAWGS